MRQAYSARAVCFAAAAGLGLAPTAHSQSTPYGAGTAGQGNFVPVLRSGDPSFGNAAFALEITQGLGGVPAALAFSLAPASLALPGGTTLLVDPFPPQFLFTVGLVLGGASGIAGAGSAAYPLPLAASLPLELAGNAIYAQAVLADLNVAGGLSATNGLELRLRLEPLVFLAGAGGNAYFVIDARSFTLRTSSSSTFTSEVDDACFSREGRYVYVAGQTVNGVHRGDLAAASPQWTPFYASPGRCFEVEFDVSRGRIYAITGAHSALELVAIDADPTSATYGQSLGSARGISQCGSSEDFALAPSGNFAMLLSTNTNCLLRVDTDPASPTYLSLTRTFGLPPQSSSSSQRFPGRVAITADDRVALVALGNFPPVGEIHRLDLATGNWIDHNPATPEIESIGLRSQPPITFLSVTGLALSNDGSFAIVTSPNSAGRLDFDPQNPSYFAWVPFAPGVSSLGRCDLSRDDASVYISTILTQQLHRLDSRTGALLGSLTLPATQVFSTVRSN